MVRLARFDAAASLSFVDYLGDYGAQSVRSSAIRETLVPHLYANISIWRIME